MPGVVVYSKSWCPFCVRAKELLEKLGVDYDEIDLGKQPERREEMIQRSGRRTVPQIWVGDTHIGGCDDLFAAYRAGTLTSLLATTSS